MIRPLEKTTPTVSVLMSVRNEAAWVGWAIESILSQTYADLELIVTDDGSGDKTGRILMSYEAGDKRVHLIKHPATQGLAGSLNEQIGLARGKYIARMDGDDIARPDRLAKQVAYLEAHPRVGMLGSYCQEIDREGRPICVWIRPTDNRALQSAVVRYNPFIHSTIMLRREVFEKTGLYDLAYRFGQDYDLWLRLSRQHELANLPEPLVDLRVDWDKLTRKNKEARRCELNILYHHITRGAYPRTYYFFLLRPLFWCFLPTGWIIKLKALQRVLRQNQYPKNF